MATPVLATESDGVTVGDDGLYKEPFFIDSFMEFKDDLAEAAKQDKYLMVIIEQDGCPYCRELHRVNFRKKEIVDYMNEHFMVVQLDLYGSRSTVDFDGAELEERQLAMKWGGVFTPTTIVFDKEKLDATNFREAEAFRLPGYLRPFHWQTSLEFVVSGAFKETDFQRYLGEKVKRLNEQGIEAEIWE